MGAVHPLQLSTTPHHSNLSLSSSSIGSEKIIDQEPPSLPPSLPPRIQEKNESSSSSSSSGSEDEQDDVEGHKASEDNREESFGQQTNNEVESSLVIEKEEFRTEIGNKEDQGRSSDHEEVVKENNDDSDKSSDHENDNGEVETENNED